jgi:hypothetical protein
MMQLKSEPNPSSQLRKSTENKKIALGERERERERLFGKGRKKASFMSVGGLAFLEPLAASAFICACCPCLG